MPELTPAQLKQRIRRYRQLPQLRLRDEAAIRDFVSDVGVCMLFPVQGIEIPNVYQAVAGFSKDTTSKHDDATISLTWNTKDRALDKRWWYYGKLLRGKATLVSLDLIPHFYALSDNYGEEDDYIELYREGKLSADGRAIFEALLRRGPLHAIELKREAGLYGDDKKTRFDRALTDLQQGLMVLPTGVAEAGAWRYAFIYDIVSRWLPDVPRLAREFSRRDARRAIARRHLANVIACTPKEAARLFGWTADEAERALAPE